MNFMKPAAVAMTAIAASAALAQSTPVKYAFKAPGVEKGMNAFTKKVLQGAGANNVGDLAYRTDGGTEIISGTANGKTLFVDYGNDYQAIFAAAASENSYDAVIAVLQEKKAAFSYYSYNTPTGQWAAGAEKQVLWSSKSVIDATADNDNLPANRPDVIDAFVNNQAFADAFTAGVEAKYGTDTVLDVSQSGSQVLVSATLPNGTKKFFNYGSDKEFKGFVNLLVKEAANTANTPEQALDKAMQSYGQSFYEAGRVIAGFAIQTPKGVARVSFPGLNL
jgi:hypothetical protein